MSGDLIGWEVRAGRWYYYRGRRDGGPVAKEHVGAGPAADLSALDTAPAPLDALADAVARAALLAAGYHRPNRGPWRKRRARPDQEPRDPAEV